MTTCFLDRAVLQKILLDSRVAPQEALSVFSGLSDTRIAKVLYELGNFSALAGILRGMLPQETELEFLRELEVETDYLQFLEKFGAIIENSEKIRSEANSYALRKGGNSESCDAEVSYCTKILAISWKRNVDVVISSDRLPLFLAVLEGFNYTNSQSENCSDKNCYSSKSVGHSFSIRSFPMRLNKILSDQVDDRDLRVLIAYSNPTESGRLDLEAEIREIQNLAVTARGELNAIVETLPAATPDDLVRSLRSFEPQIVHFSGHSDSAGLQFRDISGSRFLVSGQNLADVFSGRGVEVIIFNSCCSETQTDPLIDCVPNIVGTRTIVSDDVATTFSKAFYSSLFDGRSVEESFKDGVDLVRLYGFEVSHFLEGRKRQVSLKAV